MQYILRVSKRLLQSRYSTSIEYQIPDKPQASGTLGSLLTVLIKDRFRTFQHYGVLALGPITFAFASASFKLAVSSLQFASSCSRIPNSNAASTTLCPSECHRCDGSGTTHLKSSIQSMVALHRHRCSQRLSRLIDTVQPQLLSRRLARVVISPGST